MSAVTVRFGPCVLDTERRELRRGGEAVHLSPKAFELLLALLESRPRPVSKADLHRRLWPSTFVHEANLANVVSELRAAIGDDARQPLFVRTVHTFGYAFSGPAAEGDPADGTGARHPFLYCLQGEAGIATLVEGDHVLGRGHESAIYLSAPSVSRRHARLQIARGRGHHRGPREPARNLRAGREADRTAPARRRGRVQPGGRPADVPHPARHRPQRHSLRPGRAIRRGLRLPGPSRRRACAIGRAGGIGSGRRRSHEGRSAPR